jgi:hypothetical protein
VQAILGDINIQGQLRVLVALLESDKWREIWRDLNLGVWTFRDLGLDDDAPDDQLWQRCQDEQIVLVTANRNHDGPTSLEATLRACNKPDSLPVFTLADAQEVLHSREYADRVVECLLEYLLEIDLYRGTGRLYLP